MVSVDLFRSSPDVDLVMKGVQRRSTEHFLHSPIRGMSTGEHKAHAFFCVCADHPKSNVKV